MPKGVSPVGCADHDQTTKYVPIIDVIRGIAALSVAFLHIREVDWIGMRAYWALHGVDPSARSIVAYFSFPAIWGSIGVPIFFVVSGYVIHLGSRDNVISVDRALMFWLRRFIRIYPTFIAALLITFFLDSFARTYGDHAKFGDLSLRNAVANLFGIVGLTGTPYGSNGALWSLAIEIQFYVAYPLALVAWRKLGSTPMVLFIVVLNLIGGLIFHYFDIKCFLTYYLSWWLGAYVADRKGVSRRTSRQLWLGISILALGCVLFFLKNEILVHTIWSLGFAIILDYLLARESQKQVRTKNNRISVLVYKAFAKLGEFSYTTYAIHLPIAIAFSVVFLAGLKQENIYLAVLMLPVALFISYIVYFAVEVPSIWLLRRMPK